MKIKLTKAIHGAVGSFAEGQEADLPEAMALALIEAKAATAVEQTKRKREYARKSRPTAEHRKAGE